jgi:tetratricopeptide (TPR) repeat protein
MKISDVFFRAMTMVLLRTCSAGVVGGVLVGCAPESKRSDDPPKTASKPPQDKMEDRDVLPRTAAAELDSDRDKRTRADSLLRRSEEAAAEGDFKRALQLLDEAISIRPGDGGNYLLRSELNKKIGLLEEAIADLSKAMELGWRPVLTDRGALYWAIGRFDDAVADAKAALALTANEDVYAHLLLARIYAAAPQKDLRNGKLAVYHAEAFSASIREDDPDALEIRAMAYAEAGQFDEAAKWQEKLLKTEIDGEFREEMVSRLDLYRNARPYRDPKKPLEDDSQGTGENEKAGGA